MSEVDITPNIKEKMVKGMEDILNNSSFLAIVAFLIPFVIFLRRFKRGKGKKLEIDKELLQRRMKDFCPKPLHPSGADEENIPNAVYEEERYIIDLAKVNYLNLLNNKDIMQEAVDCVRVYGVGTCGPRSFFGTTDKHICLEKELSQFLGTDQTITYAYGFITIQSTIMSYCNSNDIVFCDEYVNFPIKQGVLSAKSDMIYFKHNDCKDLEQKLEEHKDVNKKKFIIIEGIYERTGVVCDLKNILVLAKQYKVRLFIDETISFGVLGTGGRGVTEHFKVDIQDVDLIIGSLENALGSIGGFCAANNALINHQRMHSKGFIYSASLPTFLCEISMKALPIVQNNAIFLQILSTKFQEFLCSIDSFKVLSHPVSPLKVIHVYRDGKRSKMLEECIFEYCRDNFLYLILNSAGISLHLNVELYFNEDRLTKVFEVIRKAVKNSLENNKE